MPRVQAIVFTVLIFEDVQGTQNFWVEILRRSSKFFFQFESSYLNFCQKIYEIGFLTPKKNFARYAREGSEGGGNLRTFGILNLVFYLG